MIPNINLLPKVEKSTSNRTMLWLGVVIAVLIVTVFAIYYLTLNSEVQSLRSQQQNLSKEVDRYNEQITNFQNESQGSYDQSVKFVESVSYPVTPIIDSLEGHLESYEKLTNVTYTESGVNITADFETLHGVSTYVQNLMTDKLYTDVQVSSVTSFDPDKKEYQNATASDLLVPRYTATIELKLNQANLLAEGERP